MAADGPGAAAPISPEAHGERIVADVATAGKSAWCYFLPFLCCYSLRPSREVRVLEHAGALCLLVCRSGDRGQGVDLLVPPLPLDPGVFASLTDRLRDWNGGRPPRVLWADAADAQVLSGAGYRAELKEREYFYSPQQVAAADGRPYRDLRKRLRRFQRAFGGARFREMTTGDAAACQALLKHWRRRQGRKHPFLLDWGYTRAAVDRYGEFDRGILNGWCVEVRGRVAAFAMAGPIRENLASFFVAKADPDVPCLSEHLRWQVFRELSGFRRVNDAGDLDLPGLRQHKAKFRPVDEVPVYTAQAGEMEAR